MNIIKKYALGIFLLFLVGLASLLIYQKLHPKKLPSNLVMGVGTILGDEINLNAKYPGRIKKIFADVGDWVKKGELLASIESKEMQARLHQADALIQAKKNLLQAKKEELEILQKSLPQNVQKAYAAYKAKKSMIKELQPQIDSLQKLLHQDKKDLKRFEHLYANHLLPHRKVELARLKLQTDSNKLKAIKQKKEELLLAAKAEFATLVQSKAALQKIAALEKSIAALAQEIAAAEGKKEEIEAMIEEMELHSPVDGYVTQKVANQGEVVGAGMTLLNLIDPKSLYLKIFVDTLQNAHIKIGDKAEIFLDAFPNDPIEAKVVKIAQKAEFTPKEVAVRSDRIQKVYGVRIKPLHSDPRLKLGLPAIGIISIDGKGLPKSLSEVPKI